MKDLGQEAVDEMNRLLLNQQRLKMKLERMGDSQIADLSKKIERLQEQLSEANEVIKHYANDENWCDYYDDDDEKMTKAIYINCDGSLEASCYLKKWGVK